MSRFTVRPNVPEVRLPNGTCLRAGGTLLVYGYDAGLSQYFWQLNSPNGHVIARSEDGRANTEDMLAMMLQYQVPEDHTFQIATDTPFTELPAVNVEIDGHPQLGVAEKKIESDRILYLHRQAKHGHIHHSDPHLLTSRSARSKVDGDTIFHIAATHGCLDQITENLVTIENLMIKNSEGQSALLLAAENGNLHQLPQHILIGAYYQDAEPQLKPLLDFEKLTAAIYSGDIKEPLDNGLITIARCAGVERKDPAAIEFAEAARIFNEVGPPDQSIDVPLPSQTRS